MDPLFLLLNPVPLTQPGPPHLPTLCPPLTLPSTHFPNWPTKQTHSPLTDQTPFPLGNATEGTLLQLREVDLNLTEEELQQWALDALLYPEDWKWLWELAPAPTPSTSLIVTIPFHLAPQTSPHHSSLDSQGLFHTLLSLSHPHPHLLPVLLSPLSSYLALCTNTFPPCPLSYTSSNTPEHQTP